MKETKMAKSKKKKAPATAGGDHAKLAPSAATRWVACPGSIALVDQMYEEGELVNTGSPAADRGSQLHDLAYKYMMGEIALGDLDDDEEAQDCLAGYERVIQDFEDLLGEGKTHFEVKLRSNKWHRDIWGTADCVMRDADDETLVILDLKTGYNPVDPTDNYQLLCYASLALGHFRIRPEKIILAIYQTNGPAPGLKTWETDLHTLEMYAGEIRQAAKLALSPQGMHIYRPGLDQCKWCPAGGRCSARAQSEAISDFFDQPAPSALMSDEQVADMLAKVDEVDAFISDLRKMAFQRAMDGHEYPGFKLVERRTQRRWSDPDKVIAALKKAKVPKTIYLEEKLMSFTKVLKDDKAAKVVGKFVVKPAGELQLVPDSDPRDPAEPGHEFRD
jgi:hypothetical protein